MSFLLIPVSFLLASVYSGTILVHFVSFRCYSASFRHIPVYSGIFRSVPFRSVPFRCLVMSFPGCCFERTESSYLGSLRSAPAQVLVASLLEISRKPPVMQVSVLVIKLTFNWAKRKLKKKKSKYWLKECLNDLQHASPLKWTPLI